MALLILAAINWCGPKPILFPGCRAVCVCQEMNCEWIEVCDE